MKGNDASTRRPLRLRAGVVALALIAAAACAVAASAGQQRADAGPVYKVAGTWGKTGKANGQFLANAYGLATDKAGTVYVADTDNFLIQVFSSKGGFKRTHAFAQGESVQDAALDPDGSVWGTALQAGEARKLGGAAATIKTHGQAVGIAVDADGNVYVTTVVGSTGSLIRSSRFSMRSSA